MKTCQVCSGPMPNRNKRCCGLSCAAKYMHSLPDVVAARNRKISATKTGSTVPEASRLKMIATMKLRGIKPKMVSGGNGMGPTRHEQMIRDRVPSLKLNHSVGTGYPRGYGVPTKYMLDLSVPELKFCVEVDGSSHIGRYAAARDKTKNIVMANLGWNLIRFTHRQIESNLDGVIAQIQSHVNKIQS